MPTDRAPESQRRMAERLDGQVREIGATQAAAAASYPE